VAVTPTVEGEELTPTMKLRRHVIAAHFASLIDGMYTETEPEPQDGASPPSAPADRATLVEEES
jgi:hypothetical protein